jgi:hypothetical protein
MGLSTLPRSKGILHVDSRCGLQGLATQTLNSSHLEYRTSITPMPTSGRHPHRPLLFCTALSASVHRCPRSNLASETGPFAIQRNRYFVDTGASPNYKVSDLGVGDVGVSFGSG